MYLMISTRPNLSYSKSLVSRYMANSEKEHWEVTKWILRYLTWSKCTKLICQKATETDQELIGYVDSDFTSDRDKRRTLT